MSHRKRSIGNANGRAVPAGKKYNALLLTRRICASISFGGIVLLVVAALTRDVVGRDLAVDLFWMSVVLILAGVILYGFLGPKRGVSPRYAMSRAVDKSVDMSERIRSRR